MQYNVAIYIMEKTIDKKDYNPIKLGKGIMSIIDNMQSICLHDITLKQIEEILKPHKTKQ